MVEDVTVALSILEGAIRIEQEGREFYLLAARTTQDGRGRETFRNLADDELKHLDLVQKQYASLTRDRRWIDSPEIRPVDVDLEQPLFPR